MNIQEFQIYTEYRNSL